jgi:hypothetical protein
MLLEGDAAGDREKGQELLAVALGNYHELGMKPHAARVAEITATR